ncbi:MAG: MATE family efflux transporter [Clostridia bacterium]|nr:MATE family efflux transporter [Clostridia bacterium]
MADKFRQDLTRGSVSKQLMKFAVPFLLSNLLQALYSVADMIIVGHFRGPIGITGVNIGSQINILVTGAALGLAVGGTVLIAQYGGAHKFDEQRKTIGTLFTLYMIIGVVMTAVMLVFGKPLLDLLSTPKEAYGEAESYYDICMAGLVFLFAYNVISAILRGMGDSKRPLYFVLIAAIGNITGDYILCGPFDMGAKGAAIATVGAQGLSVVLSLLYLLKNKFFAEYRLSDFKIDKEKSKMLLKIGLPSSVQQVVVSFSFLTLTALVNSLPNALIASACQGIGGKVNSFAILPALAMSSAVSSMAGQNIGAGEIDRARKTMFAGMRIAFMISAFVFIIVVSFPDFIIGLFDKTPETIETGRTYLRLIALDYLLVPFVFCMNGLAIGAGYTNFALFNACFSSIIVRVPLAYIVVKVSSLGFDGVGLATGLASAASIIVGIIFISSGKWKKPKIRI